MFTDSEYSLYFEQVGVKNKTSEVQSKLTNVVLVDVNKNQVCIYFARDLEYFFLFPFRDFVVIS